MIEISMKYQVRTHSLSFYCPQESFIIIFWQIKTFRVFELDVYSTRWAKQEASNIYKEKASDWGGGIPKVFYVAFTKSSYNFYFLSLLAWEYKYPLDLSQR